MAAWEHGGGFSIDAAVRIERHDRNGLQRLLRYCARPALALQRLRQIDPEHLVYASVKPGPGGSVSLLLTPLELLDRLAALIPPPRKHRHRYYGVLAPHLPTESPLREAVTALSAPDRRVGVAPDSPAAATAAGGKPMPRQTAHDLWALLLARIYAAFPLICPRGGGELRSSAFITAALIVQKILTQVGEPTSAPRLAKARGPPLWAMQDAATGETDSQVQPEPDYPFDQRVAW